MKSVLEIIQLSTDFLQKNQIQSPRRIAEELLSHVLGLKRVDLYLQFDRPVMESELEIFRSALKRSAKHEPVEYILGSVDFCGCAIRVDPRVLIPRQETEVMVDWIFKSISPREGNVLFDLCSGSGAIGIACKKKYPFLRVISVDLSKEAIDLSRENSLQNQTEIQCIQGDLIHSLHGFKADFVICNPPYLSEKEYLNSDPSVQNFEPKMALVGGEKGIEYYERIANELPAFLNPKAKVFLEIGYRQKESVQNLFLPPLWNILSVQKDWSGHDRFFFLEKQ